MTPAQEARNHRRLYRGQVIPRPAPAKPALVPVYRSEPPDLHPERKTDPRWQRKKFRQGSYVDFLRRNNWLDQSRLDNHFARASRSQPGTTAHAVTASLATGVGTPGDRLSRPGSTPNPSLALVSQPQAPKAD